MKYLACALLLAVGAPAFAQQTDPQPADAPAAAPAPEATPLGGYAPADPALRGAPEPGSKIVFVPSVSPSQAFPPPAALPHYPPCKRGQFTKCLERR